MFNTLSKRFIYAMIMCALFLFMSCAKDSWIEKYGIQDPTAIQSPSSIPALIKALDDPDLAVRNRAIKYLRSNNNETAIEPAKKMAINDPHTNNRTAALAAFMNMPVSEDEMIIFLQEQAESNSDVLAKKYALKRLDSFKKQNNITKLIFENGDNIEIVINPNFHFFNGYKRVNVSEGYGILPITFTIKNNTDSKFIVSNTSVVFFKSNGIKINSVSLHEAISAQSYSHSAAAIIRGPWAIKNSVQANVRIENFCKENYLDQRSVSPRSSVEGVLFFRIDKNNVDISNQKLEILLQSSNGISYLAEYVFWNDVTTRDASNSVVLKDEEVTTPTTQVSYIESDRGSSLFDGVPEATKNEIKEKCKSDFPNDFSSQASCAKKQVEGWKLLNN